MSQAKYCGSCGYKNEFGGVSPKFCTNCGDPFEKAFKVEAKKHAPVSRAEEGSDDTEVAALHFEIRGPRPAIEPVFQKVTKEWVETAANVGSRNLSRAQSEAREALAGDKTYAPFVAHQPPQRAASSPQRDAPSAPADV